MASIISIQSHVSYGYVGNKAAVYPLQRMGHDVWPINTVQFSNHTGYGKWRGQIFDRKHIREVFEGLGEIGVVNKCGALLSGYMGDYGICQEVSDIAKDLKSNKNLKEFVYLCDPVIGNNSCYVKPEVLRFFQESLSADIITPNQFEAEILVDRSIKNLEDIKGALDYFHNLGIKIVLITGIKFKNVRGIESRYKDGIYTLASNGSEIWIVESQECDIILNGTGDLFSALFLGNYLNNRCVLSSMRAAVYHLNYVMDVTLSKKSQELCVLEGDYKRQQINLPTFQTLSL